MSLKNEAPRWRGNPNRFITVEQGSHEAGTGYDRVVVIGGGYIGLEAASVLTKLGKQVVLLEALGNWRSRGLRLPGAVGSPVTPVATV